MSGAARSSPARASSPRNGVPKHMAYPSAIRTMDSSSLRSVASVESRATVVLPLPEGPQNRYAAPSRTRLAACTTSPRVSTRSEEHTSELQSRGHLVCRLLLEKKKQNRLY